MIDADANSKGKGHVMMQAGAKFKDYSPGDTQQHSRPRFPWADGNEAHELWR